MVILPGSLASLVDAGAPAFSDTPREREMADRQEGKRELADTDLTPPRA
jgi:hypothetical protein